MFENDTWNRPHWSPGGDTPFVFVVVYGLTEFPGEIQGKKYRTRGLPDGIEARAFDRARHGDYLRECYEEGYTWKSLVQEDPELAERVRTSEGAIALSGDVVDDSSLLYLRDVIGITAALADAGAVAVYDPLTFRWWRPDTWIHRFHEPDRPQPKEHVMILYSEDGGRFWFHTRGLITFGRPDLSVRSVERKDFEAAAGMCNELIELQAAGAKLVEGQTIRHPVLGAFNVRYAGDRDDLDFNNIHVELEKPN